MSLTFRKTKLSEEKRDRETASLKVHIKLPLSDISRYHRGFAFQKKKGRYHRGLKFINVFPGDHKTLFSQDLPVLDYI